MAMKMRKSVHRSGAKPLWFDVYSVNVWKEGHMVEWGRLVAVQKSGRQGDVLGQGTVCKGR